MSATLATLAADPARVDAIDRVELPALAGEAAALHARILARLVQAPTVAIAPRDPQGRLLDVGEAAERLGTSRRWIYRHQDQLPTRKLPGGALRFSERELERWQARR
jgi:excisionase family DNA binding protein